MNNYWRSIEEKDRNGENQLGLQDKKGLAGLYDGTESSLKSNRRDFLKLFGFSIGIAAVASSCENPVKKAIPYLVKPENVTPGKASYFATSYFSDNKYCSLLVKVRDGRPIKIEGNTLSPVTKGGTSAQVQGSVLTLYDTHRFRSPMIGEKETSWEEIDSKITDELKRIQQANKKIIILSSTIISPSTKAVFEQFKRKYTNTEIITYDAVSASSLLEANEISFGSAVLPSYHFEKANTIVSFGADFLGTWLDPITFSKGYAETRDLNKGSKILSKHYQFESMMSLTGSNADERIIIKPSEEKTILANLYNKLASAFGRSKIEAPSVSYDLDTVVDDLLKNKGKSLVISGSNDIENQLIVNAINQLLQNYGSTLDINKASYCKQGIDADIKKLKADLENKKVGAILFLNTNPVYNLPGLKNLIGDVELTVSLSYKPDETTARTSYICPDHNFLESWNDFEPYFGEYSLAQPVIHPIFKTRQAQESLLKWSGVEMSYYDFIRQHWKKNMFPGNKISSSFDQFWNKVLQDGCISISSSERRHSFNERATLNAVKKIEKPQATGLELTIYEKVAIGSGELANIPWLQELPDPVTKATWDNYLLISPKYANEEGLKTGEVVRINDDIELPVYIQPGQEYNTVSIALGYGRENAGLVADGTGVDIYPYINFNGNSRIYTISEIKIEKTGRNQVLAITQTHHSMEGRALIRETSLEEFLVDPASGNEMHEKVEHHHTTLYKKHEFPGHHWGMGIDLNKCTGCSACVIACQVENNIPVVGRKEVHRVHEMHWIRIDRYYKGSEDEPEVVRQPVMCQHCDNAPCENVCPVAATNHSSEGLNQMAYNRCIGTRYCNNNCPYKVRRFNYFDYNGADSIKGNEYDPSGLMLDLPRMVLNPDVTIRAKGVIEKCSFCVQRIQDKKLQAKLENRELQDGEILPACAQACPSDAIVFGDLNDPESKVSKYFENERNYHLLEELHTLPSVGYLTKVMNRKPEEYKGKEEHDTHEKHKG